MSINNYFFSLVLMFMAKIRILEIIVILMTDTTQSFHNIKLHLTNALQYYEKLEEL